MTMSNMDSTRRVQCKPYAICRKYSNYHRERAFWNFFTRTLVDVFNLEVSSLLITTIANAYEKTPKWPTMQGQTKANFVCFLCLCVQTKTTMTQAMRVLRPRLVKHTALTTHSHTHTHTHTRTHTYTHTHKQHTKQHTHTHTHTITLRARPDCPELQ